MPLQRSLLVAAASAALALATGCATHPSTGMQHTSMGAAAAPAAASLAPADMSFAMTAAGTDMYEIQASQLARARATIPALRNYAQMLVDHHTHSSNELKSILAARGVTPPTALPADKQAQLEQLQRLDGAAFERAYVRMTGVETHQAAIGVFENASRTLADADLRNFATKTLPVLRQHLRGAQEIAAMDG